MRLTLALACAALAMPAAAADPLPYPPVARWPTLPRLAFQPKFTPRPVWVERARALEGREDCRLPADAGGVVRLRVPFVVLLSPKGDVIEAHADAPDCAPLAVLIEQFARQLGPKMLRATTGAPPLWRASHFLAGWKK